MLDAHRAREREAAQLLLDARSGAFGNIGSGSTVVALDDLRGTAPRFYLATAESERMRVATTMLAGLAASMQHSRSSCAHSLGTRPRREMPRFFAPLLLISTLLSACAAARPAQSHPQASPKQTEPSTRFFGIPGDTLLQCAEYSSTTPRGIVAKLRRYEYTIGVEPLPTRTIHLEVDSLGGLTGIVDAIYLGDVTKGGSVLTAAAAFRGNEEHGALLTDVFTDAVTGVPTSSPQRAHRWLSESERRLGRALGDWLIRRGCTPSARRGP